MQTTRAPRVCVCVCVCVIMRRRLLLLSWLFHRDCCAVAIHPDHAVGKGSLCCHEWVLHRIFTACYTFLLLLCRKVGGGRKTASMMSAKRVYEQARTTLRTEQRGTDSRVKEHKRQRKQILSLSISLSLSLSLSLYLSLDLSLFLSLCFCHHIFFIWIDLLFNDKHIDTACFLCLFPFYLFSFVCVFLCFGCLHRASHCTAQPCRLQSATLQKNASIIWFHSRLSFCCSCLGVDAAAGWNPRTNLELLGELLLACLWGDLSHHHCFTKFKKKKKTVPQNHNLRSDLMIDFLP